MPFHFKSLAYLDIHPPDDKELENLPHVILTSDADWNPNIVDSEIDLDEWLDAQMDLPGFNEYGDQKFDAQGNYHYTPDELARDVILVSEHRYDNSDHEQYFFDSAQDLGDIIDEIDTQYKIENRTVNPHKITPTAIDFDLL
jgi:hypothetical protein